MEVLTGGVNIVVTKSDAKLLVQHQAKYFDPARIDEEVKMRLAKLTHEDILKVIKKNREFDRKQAKFDNRYFSTPTKTTYAELERAKNQLRKQFKEEAKYRFEDKFLEENEEYLKICTVSYSKDE